MPTLEETLRQHKSGIVPIPNMECGGPGSGRHKVLYRREGGTPWKEVGIHDTKEDAKRQAAKGNASLNTLAKSTGARYKVIKALSDTDFDVAHTLSPLEPVPTGWDTKVENPGDRKLTPEEKQYNTELARHQGGAPSYATVAQVARTSSVDNVY